MAKSKKQALTIEEMSELVAHAEEIAAPFHDAFERMVFEQMNSESLLDLQRSLVLAARDFNQIAAKLYTGITIAQNSEIIRDRAGRLPGVAMDREGE